MSTVNRNHLQTRLSKIICRLAVYYSVWLKVGTFLISKFKACEIRP